MSYTLLLPVIEPVRRFVIVSVRTSVSINIGRRVVVIEEFEPDIVVRFVSIISSSIIISVIILLFFFLIKNKSEK
jgi:hypothetical protein